MPDLAPFSLPPDAFEQASAKTTDFYADLTDEERASEGLPGKESPATESKPDVKPEPEPESEPEASEAEGSAEAVSDQAKLFEEIAALRDEVLGLTGTGNKSGAKTDDEDEVLAAALEHEDPVVRGLAERYSDAEKRLARMEADALSERTAKIEADVDAEFDFVEKNYTIGGKPLTTEQLKAVETYALANPELAARLNVEQLTRLAHPEAVKSGAKPGPGKPASAGRGAGPPAATIVTESSSGGAPAGPWKPRPNETIESAVKAAGQALFGVKR